MLNLDQINSDIYNVKCDISSCEKIIIKTLESCNRIYSENKNCNMTESVKELLSYYESYIYNESKCVEKLNIKLKDLEKMKEVYND